jgi:hypothetical protein
MTAIKQFLTTISTVKWFFILANHSKSILQRSIFDLLYNLFEQETTRQFEQTHMGRIPIYWHPVRIDRNTIIVMRHPMFQMVLSLRNRCNRS